MPLALSGTTPVWGEFPGETRAQFVDGLTTFLLRAGWVMDDRVSATVDGVHASNPFGGQTVQTGALIYTFQGTIVNSIPRQVKIGATLADSLRNLVSAINHDPAGQGTLWSTITPYNPQVTAAFNGTDTVTLSYKYGGAQGSGTPTTYGPLLGGGYKVRGISPQTNLASTLTAKSYIYDKQQVDAFSNKFSSLKMSSADESLSSAEKLLNVQASRRYKVVANRCQFFCYVAGTAADQNGSVICGGVPWIAPTTVCSGEPPQPATNLAFWVSTDQGLGSANTTPRTATVMQTHFTEDSDGNTSVIYDSAGWAVSDAAYNSSLLLGGNPLGEFRMLAMTPAANISLGSSSLVDNTRWFGNGDVGIPLLLEPLVAWADPLTPGQPLIRGQVWDAWIRTDQVAMDTVQTWDDSRIYVALTNQSKFGTLWLYVPSLVPLQIEDIQASYAI